MNRLLFLSNFIILTFLLSFQLLSQTTESVSVNGEKHFVYPHKLKLNPHSDYKYALKKKHFKKIFYEFDVQKQSFDKEELKELKSDIRKDKRRHSQFLSIHHKGYKYKKAIRKNYAYFFQPDYSLEQDVVPSLDSLPDGKYVQYFEDFIIGDLEGNIIIEKNKIAGIFSIKNNLLEGKAIWLDIQGDTLKQGTFHNGVKEGEWALRNYIFYDEYFSSYERIGLINNQLQPDTLEWNAIYSNGLKNGAYHYSKKQKSYITINDGHYTNDQETGTWIIKSTRKIDSYRFSNRNDLVVLQKYTYNSSDSLSHQYLIRNKGFYQFPSHIEHFDFSSNKFAVQMAHLNYFKINFPIEKNRNMYHEQYNGYGYKAFIETLKNRYIYDYGNIKSNYTELTEKFGKKYLFEGEYESYYPNGQLMFHFNFKDNQLEKEDTIFWDNGKPMDVVISIPDLNQFTRSIFDYTGKLFLQNLYDAKGNFLHTLFDAGASKQLVIENLPVEYRYPYFEYKATLDSTIIVQSDTFLVAELWHDFDTTLYKTTTYVPNERKLIQTDYSISGKIINKTETVFESQFTAAIRNSYQYHDDFCLFEQCELEFFETPFIDLISGKEDLLEFDIISCSELKLLKNNIPYNGAIYLKNNLFTHTHSKNGESIIKTPHCSSDKIKHLYKKWKKSGKQKKKFEVLDYTHLSSRYDINDQIENVFFPFYWPEQIESYRSSSYNLQGQFINGEANGKWLFEHNNHNKSIEMHFSSNILNGPLIIRSNRNEYNYKLSSIKPKPIFVENYVDGTLQGPTINNLERTKIQANYVDDELHGLEIKSLDDTYFSVTSYDHGDLNGPFTVYKVNDENDTTYFTKANFKNGILEGNAVKYNPKGQLIYQFENNTFTHYDTMELILSETKCTNGYINSEKIFDHGLLDLEYRFNSDDSLIYKPLAFYHHVNLLQLKRQLTIKKTKSPYSSRYTKKHQRTNYAYDLFEEFDDDLDSEYSREIPMVSQSLMNKNFINYTIIKYYGNGKIAREGELFGSDKVGNWKHYSYEGRLLYEINYADTTITLNDSISFQNFGTFILYDSLGTKISESYIIENLEKYDCSNNDHYTIRQFYTIWEKEGVNRINGYVKNYYDNGVLQSEGLMKNGLPEGVWKYYDPFGKLNQLGKYTSGLKEGRWITGDLGKIKYLGDICFDPNIPNIEKLIKERETELDIKISIFVHGKSLNNSFYEINKFGSNSSSGSSNEVEDIPEINIRDY